MIFGPNLVTEAEEIVHRIQSNLKAARARQEGYANKISRPLEFEVGDRAYLRVSPMWGVKRFRIKGKLTPRYISWFLVLAKLGAVVYRLQLLPSLVGVHNVFHISHLKKCLKPPTDVVVDDVVPLDVDLPYPQHQVKLLGQQDQVMRRRTIQFYKVQWSRHSEKEATWETEDFLCSNYPDFLPPQQCACNLFCNPFCAHNLGMRFPLRGEGCNIPRINFMSSYPDYGCNPEFESFWHKFNQIHFEFKDQIWVDFSFELCWPLVKVFNTKVMQNIPLYLQKKFHISLRSLSIFPDFLLSFTLNRNSFQINQILFPFPAGRTR
jgi:hypothetical protein